MEPTEYKPWAYIPINTVLGLVAQNIASSSGTTKDFSVRLQGCLGHYRAQMPCSPITFEIVLRKLVLICPRYIIGQSVAQQDVTRLRKLQAWFSCSAFLFHDSPLDSFI